MTSFEYDENETPFDNDDEYEYAGNEDDEDMNQVQEQFSDEDESEDEEQIIVNQNNSAEQHKSQASYTDEMNLIDYVIEEEKEIGGNKGEDSLSTSRSATFSK